MISAVIAALLAMCAAGRAHALPMRSAHSGGARAPDLRHRLQHQTINETCPRFATVRLAPQGVGHLFFDIVAGIDLAHRLNATYVLDDAHDLRDLESLHGPEAYEGLLDVLNVKRTEHGMAHVDATFNPTHFDATYDEAQHIAGCNTCVKVSDMSCSDPKNISLGRPFFCHVVMEGLYQRMRPVFMTKFMSSPVRPRPDQYFDPRVTNIAWHVRTGDANLLSDRPSYFENVYDTITRGCRMLSIKCRHHVFSSMGAQVPPHFQFLTRLDGMTFYRRLTAADTVLAMSTADVVVESGSSMTAIVRMLTDEPIFVTPCPKEGCRVTSYDTANGIFVDGDGKIEDVQHLHGRMQHSFYRKRMAAV